MVDKKGAVLVAKGTRVDDKAGRDPGEATWREQADIEPWVTMDVDYLTADEEEKFVIAQANAPLSDEGHFLDDRVLARYNGNFVQESDRRIDYMDISPRRR